jgi:hypothetical protein
LLKPPRPIDARLTKLNKGRLPVYPKGPDLAPTRLEGPRFFVQAIDMGFALSAPYAVTNSHGFRMLDSESTKLARLTHVQAIGGARLGVLVHRNRVGATAGSQV